MRNNDKKQVLKKVVLFFLPLLLLCFYLEYNLRTQPFSCSYAIKKHDLENRIDSIETLVLGSSHALCGVDVGLFKTRAFNLANVSQTLYYDKALTLQYLPKLKSLKNVIITIDYISFFYELCDTDEAWRENYYNTYFEIDALKPKSKNLLYLQTFNFKHALSLAFNGFKDETATKILNNGFQPRLQQLLINDSTGFIRMQLHHKLYYKKRFEEKVKSLTDFIQQLQQKNIKVVLVGLPVFETYSKYYNNNIVAKNNEVIQQLCSLFSIKYIDLSKNPSFTKEHFYDNDHLNNYGAMKCSKMLSDSLNL